MSVETHLAALAEVPGHRRPAGTGSAATFGRHNPPLAMKLSVPGNENEDG